MTILGGIALAAFAVCWASLVQVNRWLAHYRKSSDLLWSLSLDSWQRFCKATDGYLGTDNFQGFLTTCFAAWTPSAWSALDPKAYITTEQRFQVTAQRAEAAKRPQPKRNLL